MKLPLENSNILFIAPKFYDYHNAIKKELINKGANVTFFPETSNNILYLLFRGLGKRSHAIFQKYYYKYLFFKIRKKKFDLFFLIKGVGMPVSFIKKVKGINPDIYLLSYQWDSVKNFDCRYIIEYFDEVFSFDPEDSAKFNMKYFPLFIREEVFTCANNHKGTIDDVDLLFLGVYQKARYEILKKIVVYAEKSDFVIYHHLYISVLSYLKQNVTGNRIEKKYVKFSTVPYSKALSLFGRSRCIVDIGSINQTGITMRVHEAIGLGKKIATTCDSIRMAPFFSENSIYIGDINDFNIPTDFIKNKSINMDVSFLSLNCWLSSLLTNYSNKSRPS